MHDPLPSPSHSPLPSTSHAFAFDTSQFSPYTSSVTLSYMTYHGTNDAGSCHREIFKPIKSSAHLTENKTLGSEFSVGFQYDIQSEDVDNPDNHRYSSDVVAAPRPPDYYTGSFAVAHSHHQGNCINKASSAYPNVDILNDVGGGPDEHDCAPTPSPQYLRFHLEHRPLILESDQGFEASPWHTIESDALQPQSIYNNLSSRTGARETSENIVCFYEDCNKTFSRVPDLDRHVLNVHNRVGHHCQVLDCNNNKGKGYCRPDKLKEHMWKKHGLVADLSYTKIGPLSADKFE